MRVRLLGTSAGGGFPQWNCNCANCRTARSDAGRAKLRSQSCIAVSSNGKRWFLINASPDIRAQIEAFPPLWPANGASRGTGVNGVLLTNADLDHTLGLFILREGERLCVHATEAVKESLSRELHLETILGNYCGVDWIIPPEELTPLRCGDGSASGLLYASFAVPGKAPKYRNAAALQTGNAVGYRLVDPATGGRVVIIPELAGIDDSIAMQMQDSDMLLLDGTFFSDDEMRRMGAGTATARSMGHLPVGGNDGSLARIAAMSAAQRVYVHINNTNPMLLEDSPERREVEAAGVAIGYDGMEFIV